MKRLVLCLAGVALAAGAIIAWPKIAALTRHPATQAVDQIELAQYVFDTRGCNDCHTMGSNGSLLFNEKGKRLGQDFEGCSRMLAAMNLIAQVSENERSPQQLQIASRFDEVGCTFCHRITPGNVGLTDVGAKLGNLHLKCVAIDSCCRRAT